MASWQFFREGIGVEGLNLFPGATIAANEPIALTHVSAPNDLTRIWAVLLLYGSEQVDVFPPPVLESKVCYQKTHVLSIVNPLNTPMFPGFFLVKGSSAIGDWVRLSIYR